MTESAIKIHKAFKEGDLETLRKMIGDTPGFPDCNLAPVFSHCLEYAIYHSPIHFIEKLLKMGADPNYGNHAGFPSIIAALSSERDDLKEIIDLLLKFGADINCRGINDWTPLHWAAANNHVKMIKYLLQKGADPNIRTRVDDFNTPLEEAEILHCADAVEFLKQV